MVRFFITSFFIILLTACNSTRDFDSQLKEIELKLSINEKEVQLDNNEKVVLKYLISGNTDTLISESVNNLLSIPKFDTVIYYFQVNYGQYKAELYNDFLRYELPTLLRDSVKNWYIHIDTPPFTTKNMKPSETTKYFMMIHTDPKRVVGIWTRNE